jgi:hypothetical protein
VCASNRPAGPALTALVTLASVVAACIAPNPAYKLRDGAPLDILAPTERPAAELPAPPPDVALPRDVAADAPPSGNRPALIGYWAFEDGAGSTTVADGSGMGNHGVLEGLSATEAFVAGKAGLGLAIPTSAADPGVRVPLTARIDGLRAFTLAAWFRRGVTSTRHQSIISRQLGNTTLEVFNLTCINNDVVVYIPGSGSSVGFEARARGVAATGVWIHAAASYDGRFLELFIDGREVASHEFPDRLVSTTTPLYLGTNKNSTRNDPFDGIIDEVALYDGPLSPASIAALAAGASPRDVR